MASYEVEHSTAGTSTPQPRRRRPDLSTFFATLNEISPCPTETRARPNAVPTPGDISSVYRSLAEAFDVIRRQSEGGEPGSFPVYDDRDQGLNDGEGSLITQMIRSLLQDAEVPPREVEGVSEEFCDRLERVPRSALKPSQTCPICNSPFLDDPYPLVVQLPCHPSHMFDLECVRPWLRLRGTCPLDRIDFGKKEREKERERWERMMKRSQAAQDDEEEEWDGMYA